MTNILFWNVCGVAGATDGRKGQVRPLVPTDVRFTRIRRTLAVMVKRHKLDVIVLAESPFEGALGLANFTEAKTTLNANKSTRTRLEIYHNGNVSFTDSAAVGRAVSQQMTVMASGRTILLVSAHLASPPRPSLKSREDAVHYLAGDIRSWEASVGHTDTVLVGDLNFDPHDDIMTSIRGLNAVASKSVALQQSRSDGRFAFPFFYNPMWSHLSEATGSLPGSYYLKTSDIDCRFWYLPDQVLIRPSLLNRWQDDDLQVLTKAGKISLLDTNDRPDRKRFSDHLPLVFTLDLG